MPSSVGQRDLRRDLVADGDLRETADPTGARPGRASRARSCRGSRRGRWWPDDAPFVGVQRRPGPIMPVPPARRRVIRSVPGPVTCESPVSACSTRTTLSPLGDSSPQRCTASGLRKDLAGLESEVADPMRSEGSVGAGQVRPQPGGCGWHGVTVRMLPPRIRSRGRR